MEADLICISFCCVLLHRYLSFLIKSYCTSFCWTTIVLCLCQTCTIRGFLRSSASHLHTTGCNVSLLVLCWKHWICGILFNFKSI